ncbi:hypothetical protein MIR68_001494 [Amoeboaphelidium protococcarum]|nr:hypothetical protein MIR68_001494 [Amoeboaphelidium protococcarum]
MPKRKLKVVIDSDSDSSSQSEVTYQQKTVNKKTLVTSSDDDKDIEQDVQIKRAASRRKAKLASTISSDNENDADNSMQNTTTSILQQSNMIAEDMVQRRQRLQRMSNKLNPRANGSKDVSDANDCTSDLEESTCEEDQEDLSFYDSVNQQLSSTIENQIDHWQSPLRNQSVEYLFALYVQVLACQSYDPQFIQSLDRCSEEDAQYLVAVDKIENSIRDVKDGFVKSQVWRGVFLEDLNSLPYVHTVPLYERLDEMCEICHRDRVVSMELTLHGREYNHRTFGTYHDHVSQQLNSQSDLSQSEIDNGNDEDAEETCVSYKGGIACVDRVLAYHCLQHYSYTLFHDVVQELARIGAKNPSLDFDAKLGQLMASNIIDVWLTEYKTLIEDVRYNTN